MPPLAPASKSPLLTPSLPLTPLSTMKKPLSLSTSIASAKPSLDAMFEYMDADGVLRRSETITNRMVLRGYTVDKAVTVHDAEQMHRSLVTHEEEQKKQTGQFRKEIEELSKMQKANAEFKVQCKAERRQWLIEGNELVETRLQLWYEHGLGDAAEDDVVVFTKANTATSPSAKDHTYVDEDGNMRRKSMFKFDSSEASTIVTDSGYTKEDGLGGGGSSDAVRPADTTVAM